MIILKQLCNQYPFCRKYIKYHLMLTKVLDSLSNLKRLFKVVNMNPKQSQLINHEKKYSKQLDDDPDNQINQFLIKQEGNKVNSNKLNKQQYYKERKYNLQIVVYLAQTDMSLFAESDDPPNLKIYNQTFGLYQCIDDSFLLTQCVPLIVYLIAAFLIEFFLGKCIYESYKYKGKIFKKKNIILGCLFLGNLAYIVFNCSRGQQYIYFFQNFFMSMQLAVIIYFFASKAFKLIDNENVKVFVKAMFGIIIVYNVGILILNFVEYYISKQGKVCKSNTWTYIRAIEFFFSLIFAGVGKYVINRMEEQIKRMGIAQHTADTIDSQNIPAPLLENIQQYNNKVAQKKKIWILIIVNLIAGITVNIKNFFILYNGRNDCRYVGHGDDDYVNGRDVADTVLVFLTKIFSYYLPIVVSIIVFRLSPEEKRVFEKEYYYEEGVYTTALGMKARRGNSEEWDDNANRYKNSEYIKSQTSVVDAVSKKSSQQLQRNKQTIQDMHQSKSINAISPASGDL